MNIGGVDLDREVLVVAEIGNNHEGDIGLAETLIGLAAEAGAQAVKFQSIAPEQLVAPDQPARLAQLRRFALSQEDHQRLARSAKEVGVLFLSTPFSLRWIEPLAALCPALKIASGDNDFLPLLAAAAQTGRPILLSTGMTDLGGVMRAVTMIETAWSERGIDDAGLVLMHCVSAYPTPPEQANLSVLTELATLSRPLGYSDHTQGIAAAVLAVALGARVIEKHFTISKAHSSFRDHQLSADPAELRELVLRVREAQTLLGDGRKRLMPAERDTAVAARRSIVAARDLPAGHMLDLSDLTWLRPGGGLHPGQENRLIGRSLARGVVAGHPFATADLD